MSRHHQRRPFLGNPKIKRRNAKLHKLIRVGTLQVETKQQLRQRAQVIAAALKTAGMVVVQFEIPPDGAMR